MTDLRLLPCKRENKQIVHEKPWETTDTACLLRHQHSRKYYGRFTVGGKQKWVTLDPTTLTVAKLRLPDEVKKIEKLRTIEPNVRAGRATKKYSQMSTGRFPMLILWPRAS